LADIFQNIQNADPTWAYLILFISAYVENIFPPIPGDTVTIIGAYLVGRNTLKFWGVFIATTLGSILGFMTLFLIAYWIEWKIIEKYQPKWVSRTRIELVENWFKKYGYWVILFNRFLSGTRSVISLVAGLSKMKILNVFFLSLISVAMWNGFLIYIGSSIGKNWKEIINYIKMYNRLVFILLIVAALLFIVIKYCRKKKCESNSPNN